MKKALPEKPINNRVRKNLKFKIMSIVIKNNTDQNLSYQTFNPNTAGSGTLKPGQKATLKEPADLDCGSDYDTNPIQISARFRAEEDSEYIINGVGVIS